jgi:hypothetical protein
MIKDKKMDLNKVFDVIDGHDGNGRPGLQNSLSRHGGISGFLFGVAAVAQRLAADLWFVCDQFVEQYY